MSEQISRLEAGQWELELLRLTGESPEHRGRSLPMTWRQQDSSTVNSTNPYSVSSQVLEVREKPSRSHDFLILSSRGPGRQRLFILC